MNKEELYQPSDKEQKKLIDIVRNSDALFTYRLGPLDKFGSVPDWDNDKNYSTHKLAYGEYENQYIVYPEVQYTNGKLIDFTRPPYHSFAGMDSAIENNNYIVMPDEKSAEWFTKNYKNIDWSKELQFTIDPTINQSVEKDLWDYVYNITKNTNLTAGILGSLYQESRFEHNRINPESGARGIAQLLGDKLKNYKDWLNKNNFKDTAKNQITFILEHISNPSNDNWSSEYQRVKRVTELPIITKNQKQFYVEPDGRTYKVEEYDEELKKFNPRWKNYSYADFNKINWDLKLPEEAAEIYTNTFERAGNDVEMRTRKNAARYFYDKYKQQSYKHGGAIINNMNYVNIEIADKKYKVLLAETEEERTQGLSNVESMDDDEGMLFVMPEDQDQVVFNTEEMEFDIDLVFIDQDDEVYNVVLGKAHSSDLITSTPDEEDGRTKYVLEVNANSGIQIGDELDFEDDEDDISEDDIDKMYILGSDGKPQMDLVGGERIFSRKNSKTLIKLAKRADKSKKDSDYRKLGKTIFKYIHQQDTRPNEYVESPN